MKNSWRSRGSGSRNRLRSPINGSSTEPRSMMQSGRSTPSELSMSICPSLSRSPVQSSATRPRKRTASLPIPCPPGSSTRRPSRRSLERRPPARSCRRLLESGTRPRVKSTICGTSMTNPSAERSPTPTPSDLMTQAKRSQSRSQHPAPVMKTHSARAFPSLSKRFLFA